MDTVNKKGNINITIKLRYACNYSCHYCVAQNFQELPVMQSIPRLRAMYRKLDSFVVTFFDCGFGEPSLHPQVSDMLDLCLEFGAAYLSTNNSISPERWLPRNNLGRLLVAAALHPQGEAKMDEFTRHLIRIKELGAHVIVIFVAHPTRLAKIKQLRKDFLSLRTEMHLMPFHGYYNGREYPLSYTAEERNMLEQSRCQNTFPHIWNWAFKLSPDMEIRDFAGIPCIAGFRTIYVGDGGKMRRCLYDLAPLDRLSSSPMPCRVRSCGCGLQLEELNTYDDIFWNYWRRLGEKNHDQESLTIDHDALYEKNKAIYWSLMHRYGKVRQLPAKDIELGKVIFPHVLFEKKDQSLLKGLETYLYGKKRPRELPVLKSEGILFNPSAKSDCLATPYIDVLPGMQGGGPWLKITLSPTGEPSLKGGCIMYVQDEDFSQISRNLLAEEESASSDAGYLIRYVALPNGIQRFRIVISALDISPVLIPNYLKIEQSARSPIESP